MYKNHKKALILSSLLTLFPIVIGLLLWNKLPDVMATHWGADNQPDGYSSKAFAVFVFPFILLGIHWLCLWITSLDPGHKKQSEKATKMTFWLIPIASLFVTSIMYGLALGNKINMGSVLFGMMGLMFMGIGNYMPKVKQNYTLGIKVTWTLNNEENWNATHRFGGKLWFFGGLFLLLAAFFPVEYTVQVLLPAILLMAFIPMVYSYCYYKKQCMEGRGYPLNKPNMDKTTKTVYGISMVVLIIILVLIAVIIFTGSIACIFNEDSFTVEASFYDDLTVEYNVIDSIEIRYESIPGTREFGFGSAKLLLGTFRNEEFDLHSRYTYTNCDCAIVLTVGEKVLVLAGEDIAETEFIYETLLEKTGLGG